MSERKNNPTHPPGFFLVFSFFKRIKIPIKIAIKSERKKIFSTGEIVGDRIFTKAFISAKKKDAQNMKRMPADKRDTIKPYFLR